MERRMKPRPLPLSARLVKLRTARGLTQIELAIAARLSLQTVAGIEQGTRQGSPSTRRKLATALGVKPSELLTSRS